MSFYPFKKNKKIQDASQGDADVFISYAWVNSSSAIQAKQAKEKQGSLGHGDPRQIKTLLEQNGIKCWLDIERVGRVSILKHKGESYFFSKIRIP